jgi:hypothetical protein
MADHGIRSRYTYELCRCEKCVSANAQYLRRYRAGDVNREREQARMELLIGRACVAYLKKNHPRIYKRISEGVNNA